MGTDQRHRRHLRLPPRQLPRTTATGSTRRVHRLRNQITCADNPTRALPFGRAAIEAKIRKQIALLPRLTRRDHHEDFAGTIASMRTVLSTLPDAGTTEEIMGI